jgi:tRNA pseudouridine38-40 synthase
MTCSRFRLDLQYHGGFFHGWQRQPNSLCVEEALVGAYERFLKAPVRIDGSGRTDTGVHARHQIALLELNQGLPPQALQRGIQPFLPEGISVFKVDPVAEDWSPRPAASRQYRYFIWKKTQPPLFYQPFAAWTVYSLDLDRMCEAASFMLGERDYSSFRASGCTAHHPIRRVDRIMVLNRGPYWEVRVTGNAFLRQMVRILVGTLVEVGRGRLLPSDIPAILEKKDRSHAGPTMPAHGLFLWKIMLPGDETIEVPPTCWEIPLR